MIVALILLLVLVAVGAILYTEHRLHQRRVEADPEPEAAEPAEECCGMHVTCEKDSLLASVSPTIEYYDDEELDRFAGRGAADYADAEVEEFRDILLSMRPDDIAGWARSLQLRQIALPADVRDELLLIVAEARAAKTRSDVAVS
ncbi:MAG: phospholipase [Muribaculaceae bacterium]|nr:phospholipase [Muribaculaceae bacterium]